MVPRQLRQVARGLPIVALVLLSYRGLAQSSAEAMATVRIEVSTEANEVLPNPHGDLIDSGTGKSVAQFRDSVASKVRFGKYILRVREPGFKLYEREVTIDLPDVLFRVRLVVADIPHTVPLR